MGSGGVIGKKEGKRRCEGVRGGSVRGRADAYSPR